MDKIQELGHLLGVYQDSRIDFYWKLKNYYMQGFYLYGVKSPWAMNNETNLLKMINKFVYQNNKKTWFTLDDGIQTGRNSYGDFIHDSTRLNFKIFNDDLIEFYEFSNKGHKTKSQIITFEDGLNKLGKMFAISKLGSDSGCKQSYDFINNFYIKLIKNGNTRNLIESQFNQNILDKMAHSLISQIKDNAEKSIIVSLTRLEMFFNKKESLGRKKELYIKDWNNRVSPLIKHCTRLGYALNFEGIDKENIPLLKKSVKEQFKNFPIQNFGMYDILELTILKDSITRSQNFGDDNIIGAWKYPYRDALEEIKNRMNLILKKYELLTHKEIV